MAEPSLMLIKDLEHGVYYYGNLFGIGFIVLLVCLAVFYILLKRWLNSQESSGLI